jgi:alkylated DNA repair protein alkB family protein 6
VLVNEYRPGEGIMPHEDGSAYAEVVATVSLGAGLCLDVLSKPESVDQKDGGRDVEVEVGESADETTQIPSTAAQTSKENMLNLPTRIFQEPRSLLITTGRAYRELMHGIASIEVDEGLNGETVANWPLLSEEGRSKIEEHEGRNVRGTRVSLTYRDVIKVSTAASRVFGLGRR